MVKTKEEQTKKERNTQRRKRKNGWFHKAYEMWEICDFEVAAYARNPDTGQIYTFRSENGVWFPPSIKDIESVHPKPEHMLPKDFEQPRIRGGPKAKRSNLRSNKGTTPNARNRKAATQKKTKAIRHTWSLPEPPTFGLTRRDGREDAVNDSTLGKDELKQGEMAFLEGLDLSLIL